MSGTARNVDEYISAYDGELRERRIALRALIHSGHPDRQDRMNRNDV